MFSVSLIGAETPTLRAVQNFARDYPELALDSAQNTIQPVLDQLVEIRLRQVVPGPVKRPIQWTSEKQRKAFFATDGFGHGIPYRRRSPNGGITSRWLTLVYVDSGGLTATVKNDTPAAPFVYGKWKQIFHTNTGWPDARPILDRIAEETRIEVIEGQLTFARQALRGYIARTSSVRV